ncbi:PBSX family phage terminase large subunit [Veillonella criceti]|uniref:Phage terminase, large subunit, PBSX family n=1 Tax=Veillonella criceti TaxID=103891 RepID=A0A380NJL4_9FIRM|nr:PBSX family phage terminase large subunit [Veillonella criceti]SUP42270.1 phage terminase, large subunit, PBSX family [Veillonella criceti]
MSRVNLSSIIATSFYKAHNDIRNHKYTHYWFKGGRGSTKSSFISIEIIKGLMSEANRHAVAFRRVKDTLTDSVYAQLIWAIETLGVSAYWDIKRTPLKLTYKPNGNTILFRGADDPLKSKSIKVAKGYIAYIWFEELAEFTNMDDINTILQSVMRGGEKFWCFYSYNPPESIRSWVNQESVVERPDKALYHSTYLEVPQDWLGEAFVIEAEIMKALRPLKYEWQYLGKPTGTGGEIFTNVEALHMDDKMIEQFDHRRYGLDWGWSIDPLAYVEFNYDAKKKVIHIYHEKVGLKISNDAIARYILSRNIDGVVKADNAEGKSITDLASQGVRIQGCVKGKGSVARTMRMLVDDINTIYIDPNRCPNAYREFTGYELEKDRHGNFKSEFPDKDNHTIDAVRYALGESGIVAKRVNY